MPNKTIPELSEIDLVDVTEDQLMVLDSGLETFKVRTSTLLDFFWATNRRIIEVIFDGVETGEKSVDVTAEVPDATVVIWALKNPANGEQMGVSIKTPDDATVVIDSGDFALAAGTYILLGV